MKKSAAWLGLVMTVFIVNGCSARMDMPSQTKEVTKTIDSGFVAMAPGIYDSADKAIVIAGNEEKKTMTFQNLATGKQYTLHYDGTTTVKDKYEQEIAISQIPEGSLVENRFFKSKKALTFLKLSPEAFTFDNLQNYSFLPQTNQMMIGGNPYALSGNLTILSDGKEIEPMDLNKTDILRVSGVDNTVYSISVERGHGYLRLKNEDLFLDGWIEIGQSVIRDVQKDMLLVVPEGTYQVKISKDGNEANQTITFSRDEEMVWDLGTVAIKEVQKGSLIFTVHPMEAQVTIDGEVVDISQPYETDYGVHQLIATAEGFDTITQYIKLNDEYANIDITMVESESEEESEAVQEEIETKTTEKQTTQTSETDTTKNKNTTETNTSSENTVKDTNEKTNTESTTQSSSDTAKSTKGDYRVYIDSPKEVEVYLDGNYIGVAPVDFKKEVGSYVITLRKSGYQTRSYSISLEDDAQDVNFSFSDLLKLED